MLIYTSGMIDYKGKEQYLYKVRADKNSSNKIQQCIIYASYFIMCHKHWLQQKR